MSPDPVLIADALVARVGVRQRDRWSRTRLLAFQHERLERLLRHARTSSPYYREVLTGAPGAPLAELPVLAKRTLMEQWDRICTSDALRLSEVERRLGETELSGTDPGQAWRGRWRLAATGGTTGRRGMFAWNRQEWIQVLTSYARVNDWAGVSVGLRRPLRTAFVSSLNPTHQSAVVGASLRSRLVPTLRLDAVTPEADLVDELNRFEPRLLVAYASMVGLLAQAQLDGRLHIRPERVVAASEPLTASARLAAQTAWGNSVVVDSYAATETASIASTCSQGGWHLCEDFVIVEPVTEDYRPVPVGVTADKVLVTVLFSRTLPLIRYELTDSIRLSKETCTCGLPFALLEAVEGRTEDTLSLPGRHGPVRVHPNVFHTALEAVAPNGWQVEQQPNTLMVRLVGPAADPEQVRRRVQQALAGLTIETMAVEVVTVTAIERTRLGKTQLVKAFSG
jgi:putative adenylate-forming enzyme